MVCRMSDAKCRKQHCPVVHNDLPSSSSRSLHGTFESESYDERQPQANQPEEYADVRLIQSSGGSNSTATSLAAK